MRFVIIYRHRDDVRANIQTLVSQLVPQGLNFALTPLNHPIFNSRPFWPEAKELLSLPMSHQCEEVVWDGQVLESKRKLIIDVEVVVEEPEPETA